MIGDWVSFKECPNLTPYQVTKLDIKAAYPINIDRKADGEDTFLTEEDLQPIPLTPEILKKNGFELISKSIESTSYRLGLREVFVFLKEGYFNITIKDTDIFGLTYVHELQHALRLCGLNEVADNFIV